MGLVDMINIFMNHYYMHICTYVYSNVKYRSLTKNKYSNIFLKINILFKIRIFTNILILNVDQICSRR